MVCRSVNVGVLMSTSFRGIAYDSSSSVCPNFIQVFVRVYFVLRLSFVLLSQSIHHQALSR